MPLCPLHAATGLWCPLCGTLRAVDSVVHGDLVGALHFNALILVLAPLTAFWWFGMRRSARAMPRAVSVAVVVLAVVFAVVRNLPFATGLRGG